LCQIWHRFTAYGLGDEHDSRTRQQTPGKNKVRGDEKFWEQDLGMQVDTSRKSPRRYRKPKGDKDEEFYQEAI